MADMVNELPSETPAADAPELSPAQKHRGLVMLVITMGVMLVAGLGFIIVTIVYRISGDDSQQNDAAAMVVETSHTQLAARFAPEISVARPAGADLIGAASAGDRLTLHFRAAGRDTIVILDLASGQVLSRVEIAAE